MNVVLLCAFNEEAVIRPTLLAVHRALGGGPEPLRVVLVDDGSSDATVAEARRAVEETGGALDLEIVSHARNRGLGAALVTGFDACLAMAADGDAIVTLDADNTHPPRLIPTLLARLDEGYELVIASRYQPGASVRGVPRSRLLISDGARFLLRAVFPIRGVRDYTCCFRAYRPAALRRALSAFGDELTSARGFEAVMDILLRLRATGVRACEVPIELEYETRVGSSKMKVLATIRKTLALIARRRLEAFTVDRPSAVRARLAAATRGARP
ncbi:MAG: glycosyltransferase family 2 protein [Myxococcota bacterium]|nr:glycosyltransferase family 2 protein [Myxococcales bacterium]